MAKASRVVALVNSSPAVTLVLDVIYNCVPLMDSAKMLPVRSVPFGIRDLP